jgi:DNA-binding MarR family transcriptional regulator
MCEHDGRLQQVANVTTFLMEIRQALGEGTPMSQTPIIRLQDFLPYQLSVAANAVSQLIASSYEEKFGLSTPEWRLIASLAELREARQLDLCRHTRMDKIMVSRAAKRLRARGLADAAQNPRDQRSRILRLSHEGWSLYESVAPAALDLASRALSCLSEEEAFRMSELLKRIEIEAHRLRALAEVESADVSAYFDPIRE